MRLRQHGGVLAYTLALERTPTWTPVKITSHLGWSHLAGCPEVDVQGKRLLYSTLVKVCGADLTVVLMVIDLLLAPAMR
nr:hypothetical protein CFP56_21939 [Quercus suber]